MEEAVYYGILYDYYQELLTEKQRTYFEGYYFLNLSLGELSEKYRVSRNAIHHQLKLTLEKLLFYEAKLKCYEKRCQVLSLVNDFQPLKEKIEDIL